MVVLIVKVKNSQFLCIPDKPTLSDGLADMRVMQGKT